jgi:hypothetical protein
MIRTEVVVPIPIETVPPEIFDQLAPLLVGQTIPMLILGMRRTTDGSFMMMDIEVPESIEELQELNQ